MQRRNIRADTLVTGQDCSDCRALVQATTAPRLPRVALLLFLANPVSPSGSRFGYLLQRLYGYYTLGKE